MATASRGISKAGSQYAEASCELLPNGNSRILAAKKWNGRPVRAHGGHAMKRIVIFFLLIIGALVAYQFLFANYTNRFRLTIEVDTPNGIKSGSSVIQTWFYESGNWGPVEAGGVRTKARGEAVYVDLGHDWYVVGILEAQR